MNEIFVYFCCMISKINIKPLSVNEAFKGRRFHTKEHKRWTENVLFMLPRNIIIPEPPFEIYLRFGFSSTASDWDNCIKQVQDSLATKYSFNDKLIRRGVVETEIVPKGKEYFAFELTHYQPQTLSSLNISE
jgi:Holliday junction resolvase RusA-like endonuclease